MRVSTTVQQWLRRAVARWGKQPLVLVCLCVLVAAAWLFLELADKVAERETEEFDHWVVRALRSPNDSADPIGPRWLEEMARDATALGGVGWLALFTIVVAGYLWLDKKHHMMVLLLSAATTGALLSFWLKYIFDRPRPDFVPHLSYVSSKSFPSGHSMLASVVYLTLGVLLASVVPRQALKMYIIFVALLISLTVGASRVYLGVHYPTDVAAGWLAGIAWALFCWLVARWLQRRGKVEDEFTAS